MIDDRPVDVPIIAWKFGYLLSNEDTIKVVEQLGDDFTDEEVIETVKKTRHKQGEGPTKESKVI